jgi:hypothetical protein
MPRTNGSAPGDAHDTVNENSPSVRNRVLNKTARIRQMDQKVIVLRVVYRNNHVVRPSRGILWTYRQDV